MNSILVAPLSLKFKCLAVKFLIKIFFFKENTYQHGLSQSVLVKSKRYKFHIQPPSDFRGFNGGTHIYKRGTTSYAPHSYHPQVQELMPAIFLIYVVTKRLCHSIDWFYSYFFWERWCVSVFSDQSWWHLLISNLALVETQNKGVPLMDLKHFWSCLPHQLLLLIVQSTLVRFSAR